MAVRPKSALGRPPMSTRSVESTHRGARDGHPPFKPPPPEGATQLRGCGCSVHPSSLPPIATPTPRWLRNAQSLQSVPKDLSGHRWNPATRRLLHPGIQSGDASPHSKTKHPGGRSISRASALPLRPCALASLRFGSSLFPHAPPSTQTFVHSIEMRPHAWGRSTRG
jgi:hypothetical protein